MALTETISVQTVRRETQHFRLVFTERAWVELVEFLRNNPDAPRICSAGINGQGRCTELLVSGVQQTFELPARVTVVGAESAGQLREAVHRVISQSSGQGIHAVLAVGRQGASGRLAGACLQGNRMALLSAIRIVGGGLPEIPLGESPGIVPWSLPATSAERDVWSRSIGALGGETAWRRLTCLSMVVIGCGRSGSLVATALARLGVRHLTLVDPDRVETHNLGEMDLVRASKRGDFKVYAVSEELERLQEGIGASSARRLKVEPIAEPVSSLRALEAAKRADLLVACVDDEAARLAAAVLAKLYLKPLLDIGSGVFQTPGNQQQAGADVRLVMPEACLLCVGGLNNLAVARARLIAGQDVDTLADWREHRAGSLRSLNMLAVGFGLRLVEALAAGRLGESAWVRVEFDARGLPRLEMRSPLSSRNCPLCRHGGWGDDGPRMGVATLLHERDGAR